jgi:hypothetical protein
MDDVLATAPFDGFDGLDEALDDGELRVELAALAEADALDIRAIEHHPSVAIS